MGIVGTLREVKLLQKKDTTYLNPIDNELDIVRKNLTQLRIPHSSHAHSLPLNLDYLAKDTQLVDGVEEIVLRYIPLCKLIQLILLSKEAFLYISMIMSYDIYKMNI